MKKTFLKVCIPFTLLVILAFASCTNENKSGNAETDTTQTVTADTSGMLMPDTAAVPMVTHAEAILSGTYPDTAVSGKIEFHADDSSGKVKATIEISVPKKANKSVAVHIHEHGDCGDTAILAHGHWNPTHVKHGKWGSGEFHSGDIGNIKLDSKGKGTLTIVTDLWTLGGTPVKNILGKSIIVHGGVDDYTSQPAGNAGTRIGCGVIR